MKTPEEWIAEYPTRSGDYPMIGLTPALVKAIQDDALPPGSVAIPRDELRELFNRAGKYMLEFGPKEEARKLKVRELELLGPE